MFAPGQSPFLVKGATYVAMTADARAIEGGFARFLEHLPDEAHRDFARTVFLPVTQYDALPLMPMTRALAEAQGVDHAASVRARSRRVAERDLGGLYRLLLRAVSPQNAVERLQRLSLRYFNFGRSEILEKERGHVHGVLREIPQALGPWFVPVLAGYAPVLIEAAGGKGAVVEATFARDGEAHGLPLCAVTIHFRWR